jgi:hypothetical protein
MGVTDLAKHQIPLRELHNELFSAESIVQLEFEVFDLDFGIAQLDLGSFEFG